MDAVGGSSGAGSRASDIHHRRFLTSPRSLTSPDNRRVIFPSLHGAATRTQSESQPKTPPTGHEDDIIGKKGRGKSFDLSYSTPIPTKFDPVLLRSNSLDGVLAPLPKLLLTSKVNEEFAPKPPSKKPQDLQVSTSIRSTVPAGKQDVHPPSQSSSTLQSRIFRGTFQRTYYPAASLPTPVNDKKSPSSSNPLSSILHRKAGASSPANEGGSHVSSLPQATRSASPCLSPAVLTLASPAFIKSHRTDSEGESIGESEDDLERLSDSPKVIPRKKATIRRNQSDSVVGREEEHSASVASASRASSVSRHASLECMESNTVAFDPHITVFEFRVSDFERKGGEKWWSEDELQAMKQEAIQRIRLRSVPKVIPTGTGRAITVTSKKHQDNNERGQASNGKPKGSILFNHPALGCDDDEFDHPECRSSSKTNDDSPQAMAYAASEIRNILVVDPHEIFLALFTKSLKHLIPHASVATARSAEEAMTRIQAAQQAFPMSDGGSADGFDIIIIEERLRESFSCQQLASDPQSILTQEHDTQAAGDDSVQRRGNMSSGSSLIRYLNESAQSRKGEGNGRSIRSSLLVGVSARLSTDQAKLENSGADCVWGKPPPEMNASLRNELLKLLMKKRNRENVSLFD